MRNLLRSNTVIRVTIGLVIVVIVSAVIYPMIHTRPGKRVPIAPEVVKVTTGSPSLKLSMYGNEQYGAEVLLGREATFRIVRGFGLHTQIRLIVSGATRKDTVHLELLSGGGGALIERKDVELLPNRLEKNIIFITVVSTYNPRFAQVEVD